MYEKTFIGVTIPREEYDPDHFDGVPGGLLSAYWQSSWRPCELNKTFVLEFLASGFERFIIGVESRIFVIAKGFERQGVTESCDVIYVCRAISPAAQYARRSALCPAGIRAFAPGYVLDRCAVCAHTPGEII